MGSKSSKSHRNEHSYSGSNHHGYGRPESVYSQHNQYSTPQHRYTPSPSPYGRGSQTPRHGLSQRYSRIGDNYYSLDQVTSALAQAGLESSNLIVGIDFTKSNDWTGSRSFNRRSLHHLGNTQNPYEQAISIIGKTMSAFDEDNLIPCYGFGDATTHDKDVFSFYPGDRYCNGFEDVLHRYREIVPNLKLAGPTSFAPIIEMAMTTVEESGGQYHVLLIIADGQVTRSVDTNYDQLSQQEQRTVDAIVRASEYPLSIVLVGVGDGPWDMMREFDDNIPARCFDNFQFVNFTEIMSKNVDISRKHTEFALAALMEIPAQYKATLELGLLGSQTENAPERAPLPPPSSSMGNSSRESTSGKYDQSSSAYSSHDAGVQTSSGRFNQSASPYISYEAGSTTSSDWFQNGIPYRPYEAGYPANSGHFQQGTSYEAGVTTGVSSSGMYDNKVCPVCLCNQKDMAFGCGHQTCCQCGEYLSVCPICRGSIYTKIRLY